VMITEYI